MDLDEYLWRYKVRVKDMAEDLDICRTTLSNLKHLKFTIKLDQALKIQAYTKGVVTLLDLLSVDQQKKVKKVVAIYNPHEYK